MGPIDLIFLAIGLSMDAFAVSICKGLATKGMSFKSSVVCGLWFGGFQALMPLTGYLLGSSFEKYIDAFAPWIAFVLLTLIGCNMIREAFSSEEDEASAALDMKTMFLLAVATSIDALAVGVSFACVPVQIISASVFVNTLVGSLVIGAITCVLSGIGVQIGNVFGSRYETKAKIVGGVILLLIGFKILLVHLL